MSKKVSGKVSKKIAPRRCFDRAFVANNLREWHRQAQNLENAATRHYKNISSHLQNNAQEMTPSDRRNMSGMLGKYMHILGFFVIVLVQILVQIYILGFDVIVLVQILVQIYHL